MYGACFQAYSVLSILNITWLFGICLIWYYLHIMECCECYMVWCAIKVVLGEFIFTCRVGMTVCYCFGNNYVGFDRKEFWLINNFQFHTPWQRCGILIRWAPYYLPIPVFFLFRIRTFSHETDPNLARWLGLARSKFCNLQVETGTRTL